MPAARYLQTFLAYGEPDSPERPRPGGLTSPSLGTSAAKAGRRSADPIIDRGESGVPSAPSGLSGPGGRETLRGTNGGRLMTFGGCEVTAAGSDWSLRSRYRWGGDRDGCRRCVRDHHRDGRRPVVAMNADGSAPVSVRVNVAATLPALPWVATGLLIAGVVFLAAGALLIAFPVFGASRDRIAAASG